MNRRMFLTGAPAAVVLGATAAVALEVPKALGRRVSCVKGDPGERWFTELTGDGYVPDIYLNGVKQDFAVTADEAEGFVTRAVATENGNIAFNRVTGEVYEETVYGQVEIRLRKGISGYDARF